MGKRSNAKGKHEYVNGIVFAALLGCFAVVVSGFLHSSYDSLIGPVVYPPPTDFDINEDIERYAIEFFSGNGAAELIPIIRCESQFRHYDESGGVLMNHQGSSATGIAQIMASVHPDPHVIKRYNRRTGLDMRVEDFDITTPIGNLQYALLLYQTRGTRDWECAKHL